MRRREAGHRLSPAYWRLWWATGIDTVGDGAFGAAVPLLALTVTGDARLVSLISTATYLPWMLFSLPAGSLVDRHDRAALMVRSQLLQALLVAGLAVLAAFGAIRVPVLTVTAFALGACDVVFTNAAQAILPDLLPKTLLHHANAQQQTVSTLGRQFAGPPVGGMLFAASVALPFWLDAASFALSAALLTGLPRQGTRPPAVPMRSAIGEGARWLFRHRLLRTLAVLLGVNTFSGQLATVVLVLLATRTLHLDARGYGLLLSASAAGSLLGGLCTTRVVALIGPLPALVTALATNVVAFAAIGLSPHPGALGASLAINGFATTVWNVVTVGLRQRIVPRPLLGRVTSVYRMLGWGLIPLGTVAGGLVAHGLGTRAPSLLASGVRGLALLAALPVLIGAMRDETGHG
ncbi:MFS transporter [Amycolatopsis cynarae]|uniref:MFS transporter n=1 Tax=Amycolatopsis cynarae TaxID=2995223 RepID=A0ABY7AY19_9PSEU|nr:MFS transporter [Amycolatopsis sp. HUAS 11-8]WAL64617.1 MFS transporter [Amycolatopsis sp. HUAS 11-8]